MSSWLDPAFTDWVPPSPDSSSVSDRSVTLVMAKPLTSEAMCASSGLPSASAVFLALALPTPIVTEKACEPTVPVEALIPSG